MTFANILVHPPTASRVRPAVLTGAFLCAANYGMDYVMDWMGTGASKTSLNDVAVGILGGLAVFFYLSASHANHCFECAKERIQLIRELNLRIRGAMEQFSASAISDDRAARLRGIDQATDQIDSVLADFMMEQKDGAALAPNARSGDGALEIPDPYNES
jgi:CheY-like chemotaxis protein